MTLIKLKFLVECAYTGYIIVLEAYYLPRSTISAISAIIIRFLRFYIHAYLKVLYTRLPISTIKILVPLTALSRANSDFLS
jgi:hypothetical protein